MTEFAPTYRCNNFVRYEGACTIIAIEVTALMMLLRSVPHSVVAPATLNRSLG